jgi:opacity protein-like surface antigen
MSVFSRRLGLALGLAALCFGGRAAHAQAAPVSYWIPGWPLGFGSSLAGSQSANTYGNFPSFDGSDAGGGSSATRYNFPNGWFVGGEGGRIGLGMNGFGQAGAFGNIGALDYQGVQFGYKFQNAASGPLTVFAGFDALKYNTGTGAGSVGPFSAFDSSNAQSGYSARAGVEFQPAPNVSLSLGVGFTQQPGRLDNDINALAASPFSVNGRR